MSWWVKRRHDLGKREPAILLELLGFHGGLAAPGSGGAPRRGGEPRLELAPAPLQHAGCPIPIPGGHPGCRGCRRDVGCTDVSATHVKRDVDCSRGAEFCRRYGLCVLLAACGCNVRAKRLWHWLLYFRVDYSHVCWSLCQEDWLAIDSG